MIRVLIVDDDLRVRSALRAFLGAHPGFDVIGEAAGSEAALEIARTLGPHVAVVDVHLPELDNGLELVHDLGEMKVPVVAISLDLAARHSALAAGASRFLDKASVPEFLLDALRQMT
ncbi:response regulator transcription factor [Kibdelosporangium philippinense]|uniref:Response regulator transcription factor n=2 Tax=Kibdelosporangium philippinense TaxID=211113 RepID=A0ABS8Z667_9PSEU|nr:response regulator transcription factor [Kibdelosporangium philippinense]MCE7003305.1 response regulator transcription factor [Kibdelosporangium philippinense]